MVKIRETTDTAGKGMVRYACSQRNLLGEDTRLGRLRLDWTMIQAELRRAASPESCSVLGVTFPLSSSRDTENLSPSSGHSLCISSYALSLLPRLLCLSWKSANGPGSLK